MRTTKRQRTWGRGWNGADRCRNYSRERLTFFAEGGQGQWRDWMQVGQKETGKTQVFLLSVSIRGPDHCSKRGEAQAQAVLLEK